MILSHHISLKINQTHEAKHGLGAKAIRKNAFENECRKTRNKKPQEMERFDEATLAKLWDDCDYSLGKYVGKTQLDADFAKVEEQLGYLLAMAYKALIHQHNGGLLTKNRFLNSLQCDWIPQSFSVESIFGIDFEKPNS